ncbi:MAG: hypothetical protein AB7I08_10555 [Thermoleophilia bacterium]
MRRRVSRAVAGSAVLLVAAACPAYATDGNLYPSDPSIWANAPGYSATVVNGATWQVQAPAMSPARAGNAWEMNWGCRPGTEIAWVRFGALRTQAASSFAVQVTADRHVVWQEGDAGMPQAPWPGRAYGIAVPGGQCNVHLVLTQTEARDQHARGWFIDNPHVLWRDVAPPSVAIRGVSPGWVRAGMPVRVDWTADDNFGSDGMAVQTVSVAGRVLWQGGPGAGQHAVEVGLADVPDGARTLQVHVAGDGTDGAAAAATVHIDRTAPTATGLAAAPAGPGALTASWTADDAMSGVASSAVELNTAPDGGTTGSWQAVATADGGGPHTVTVPAAGVPDGVHAWRVRTTDVAGNTVHAPGPGGVLVDRTPPRLDLHGVPTGWVGRADLDVSATDDLEGVLGPVRVEVDVNTAADGGAGGEWQRRADSDSPAGRRVIAVDLSGLDSGRHLIRVIARNGGGLGGHLATERTATLRVDRDRPDVSRADFSARDDGTLTATWAADDAHSGVATTTVQWRDGSAWRTLGTVAATDGPGSVTLDAGGLPAGHRSMRVLVTDAAGNAATRAGAATVSSRPGLGSTAGDPLERLRTARLSLTVAGARRSRAAGRTVLLRRLTAGATVTIRGRLTDRSGRAMGGSEVQARGHRGVLVGRALTRPDGRFTLVARPVAGGTLRVGVLMQGRLLPERASADLRLAMRPRLSLAASGTTAVAGGRILFSGRLDPAPRTLGLGGRKGVVLEWLDPVRRTWRPVVNGRIRPDGTFAIPWTFGVRGLTIPMRVTVPGEVGWPLLPVRSGVIPVRVS